LVKGEFVANNVIMVEYGALSKSQWWQLHELSQDQDMAFIVVGEGLQYKENVHRLYTDRSNLVLSLIKPFYYTNSFKLRRSFVKYSSELGYDFDNMACITSKKVDVKNNIVVNKNLFERVLKFYKIESVTKECQNCHGDGTIEHYDQCGCVESKSNCSYCGGKGKITRFRQKNNDHYNC